MRVTEAKTATLLHTTRQRHHSSCVFCAKMSVLGFMWIPEILAAGIPEILAGVAHPA